MARIVLMKDSDPLVIGKDQVKDEELYICRCGLSAQWPLCDSSHALARKERPDTTYRYHRKEPEGRLEQDTTDKDTADLDPRPTGPEGGT